MSGQLEPMAKIMLVDDQDIVRKGFREVLDKHLNFKVVAEAVNGKQAAHLATQYQPDIIILDIHIRLSGGIDLIQDLLALTRAWDSKIVVLTATADDIELFFSLRAGASGFLLKDASEAELIHAISSVVRGHAFICPALTKRLLDKFHISLLASEQDRLEMIASLTDREVEVLAAIGGGKSNLEIARELHLSIGTVKAHVSRMLGKLGMRSRVDAALLANHLGLAQSVPSPPTARLS